MQYNCIKFEYILNLKANLIGAWDACPIDKKN